LAAGAVVEFGWVVVEVLEYNSDELLVLDGAWGTDAGGLAVDGVEDTFEIADAVSDRYSYCRIAQLAFASERRVAVTLKVKTRIGGGVAREHGNDCNRDE
jgi:hypothetical protein